MKKIELTPGTLRQKLLEFEKKHGMPSSKFYSTYVRGHMDEKPDYIKWAAYYDMAAKAGIVKINEVAAD